MRSMKMFGLVAVLALAPLVTQASVVVTLQSGSPTVDGANYKFTYDSSLTAKTQLQNGDYFSLIDFMGYVPSSIFSTNPNFTASVVPTTTPPPSQTYPDDSSIVNLLFTYTGAPTTGPVTDLGNFGADSTLNVKNLLFQTAQTHKESRTGSGTFDLLDGNTTQVQGPGAVNPVPEPTTVAGLAMGLIAAVGFARRRRAI